MRLERRNPRPADHLNVYFNSIKVRLELGVAVLLFSTIGDFNSIKVRLEQGYAENGEEAYKNFNSIKVRLEPPFIPIAFYLRVFQFHKGAIRTCL